jgi:hypothetical protein
MHVAFAVGRATLTEKTSTGVELKKVNTYTKKRSPSAPIAQQVSSSNGVQKYCPRLLIRISLVCAVIRTMANANTVIALFPPTHFSEDLAYA